MTRVNLVPPKELMDQHLLAEWRELKMVPASLRRSLRTKSIENILRGIPETFTLGRGHVLFFYNKLPYLRIRYRYLVSELLKRGFVLEYSGGFSKFVDDLPDEFFEYTWIPTPEDVAISRARIADRIAMKPTWYRYYGKPNQQ
jgi:deoxyribonuclease (pyrimidine dimer)